jgi:hypothetical protein
MQVDAGPNFGDGYPNLREGMVCVCGSKNRDRLMLLALRAGIKPGDRVVMFGSQGPLADWVRRMFPGTRFCEYLGDRVALGAAIETPSGTVFNEDLRAMTFAGGSVDVLIHCDVLEHVPRVELAAIDSHRVLSPGGRTVFTMPFFQDCDATVVRAVLLDDGRIDHRLPPEMHGDPMQPEGVLAYYNFGWDVLDHFRGAGFAAPDVRMIYDPFRGLVSNGCQYPELNMLPVFCAATKQ